MSLSKSLSEIQINNQINRRDSFSDRVCDKLAENILKNLPLKDKFRYECVSKQFQRTVYQRHYHLTLTVVMCQSLETVETILKKLSNIKSLKSSVDNTKLFHCRYVNKEEIDLITKYSNHLIELDVNLIEISKRFGIKFLDKFGPQLTTFSIHPFNDKLIFKSLVNIQEIIFESFDCFESVVEFYTQIKSNNLKKLWITVSLLPFYELPDKDIKYLDQIIDYNKNITHLCIHFHSSYKKYLNLSNISQLNQLISLRIDGMIDLKTIKSDFKQLADNCLKLKSLSITFLESSDDLKNNDFMSEIKSFKNLKRFDFTLFEYSGDLMQFEDYFRNSLKTGFEDLTHLSIDFVIFQLNESLLEDIVNHLPNLQNLSIKSEIKVTEKTAEIVSRLSKLETLFLNIPDKSLSDLLKNKIREKSRNIKSILFTPIED